MIPAGAACAESSGRNQPLYTAPMTTDEREDDAGKARAGVEDDPKQAYRAALEQWRKHLDGVHELLLEGKRMPPEQIKGLLNREARAKERYDAARRRLLGIE